MRPVLRLQWFQRGQSHVATPGDMHLAVLAQPGDAADVRDERDLAHAAGHMQPQPLGDSRMHAVSGDQ